MTEEKKGDARATARGALDLVGVITGRIGKITALCTAAVSLSGLVMTQYDTISKWVAPPGTRPVLSCVEVDALSIPAAVKIGEWDAMKVSLNGRTTCSSPQGLYVTFVRTASSKQGFVLGVPHDDLPQCKGAGAAQERSCWEAKKPILTGKGTWHWDIQPPPLTQLSDGTGMSRISFNWAVYDYDEPTKPAIRVDKATIEIQTQ